MKNKFFRQRSFYAVFLSVTLSVVLVAGAAGAVTTISTNINTGGTLTVSGLTSLNGNANVGDATSGENDLVYLYGTTTVIGAQAFILGSSTATELSGQAEGAIFYSSADNLIRLYNGTSWITIASSTSGSGGLINTSDKLVLFNTVATGYMALGSTTGLATNATTFSSVLTLQATTTASVPLTIFGPEDGGGTTNLFEILNGLDGSELFAIDENGQASTTASFQIGGDNTAALNGDLYVSGMATTTGASGNIDTDGSLTVGLANNFIINSSGVITTNASTTASFGVGGAADIATAGDLYVSGMAATTGASGSIATQGTLTVGGDVSGTAGDRNFAGVCTLDFILTGDIAPITASSTAYAHCNNATGVTAGDNVFVTATSSLNSNVVILSASSTAGAISVRLFNTGIATGTVTIYDEVNGQSANTSSVSLQFWAFR